MCTYVKCRVSKVTNLKTKIANMADAALARREARRKKILENSHNRLQLISGKNGNELCKESLTTTLISEESKNNTPAKEIGNVNKCLVNNGMPVVSGLDNLSFLITNQENFALGDGDVSTQNHDLTSVISPVSEPAQVTSSTLEKLVSYKYDIVVLSLFIQLLYSFSFVTFEGAYFFLPLALYVTTKLTIIPKQQNSNFANIILMLNGMSPNRAQKIMSVAQLVSTFAQDVCIFLFTIICIQSLWQSLNHYVL